MITQIDEIIRVVVVFGGDKKLRPVYFLWKNRKYKILKITYTWISWEGKAKIYHFSALDTNDNLFELCYNSESMVWKLVNVQIEE